MELANEVVDPAVSRLGRLAVERGWLDPSGLDRALAEQRRRDEAGRHEPLGAILVALGLMDAPRLGEVLVAQQRARRHARPAPPRLSRHENAVIGAWLIDAGIVDALAIERLTRLQREALRDGDHKQLGELALELDLVPAGRLGEVTAWLEDPRGADARFAARPDLAWLLDQFVAAHESSGELGRYQLVVQRSGVPGEVGRVFALAPDRPMLIGRDVPMGLTIDEPLAAGVHAQLAIDDVGRLVVTDLGSEGGTFAAGVRMDAAALSPGDAFRIGGTILSYVDRDGDEPSSSTISSILAELEIAPGSEGPAPEPAAGAGVAATVAHVDRTRAIFREFYARESQLRALADDVAPGGAAPRLGTDAPAQRPSSRVPVSGRMARMRRASSRVSLVARARLLRSSVRAHPWWRAAVVGAVVLVAALFAVSATSLARRSAGPPSAVPGAVRALHLPPPAEVPVDAGGPGSALDDAPFEATLHRSRVLRGPTGDRFAGFLVHEGRTLACEISVDRLDAMVRLRLPLPDGIRVRVRGRAAPYSGVGVLLPDGTRARTRLELESLEVQDAR